MPCLKPAAASNCFEGGETRKGSYVKLCGSASDAGTSSSKSYTVQVWDHQQIGVSRLIFYRI